MPKVKLTAAAVEKMKPSKAGRVDYFDEVLPAFGLRVSVKRVKSWFVMTRVHRRLIRVTLGRYLLVSLADARQKAREVMECSLTGIDPRDIREKERQAYEEVARNTYQFVAVNFWPNM